MHPYDDEIKPWKRIKAYVRYKINIDKIAKHKAFAVVMFFLIFANVTWLVFTSFHFTDELKPITIYNIDLFF